jgi:YYY domain-containing protein
LKDILGFLSWYLVITLIGLFSLPIAFRLFSRLGSRGYALIRPLSLLVWGFAFWLMCSLGVLQNDLGGVLTAFGFLILFSVLLMRKGKWKELGAWIKQNWRFILVTEIVFFVMFTLWTLVRAANPDAAYTEKPMEMAFINSILRSEKFPPNDPWLSGYAISYYYFGYVIVSMLIRVTGVATSVAFNLSSSLWFGMTGLAAYGILHDLLNAWQQTRQMDKPGVLTEKKSGFIRTGALLGPFFLLILGNLEGFLELLYARRVFWKVGSDGVLTSRFWNWLGILELNVPPTQPVSWILNRSTGWIWWRGSRVIQDLSISGGNIEVIDEFPFFTYLISDLHPHLLAMPFCLLAISLTFNLFLSRENSDFPFPFSFKWLASWRSWMTLLILGSLAFFNTWDFPIYVGLFALVVVYKRIQTTGWGWRRVWEFIQCGLVLGIGGGILFLPFYLGFQSQAGGLLPSLEYITRGINFWVMFGTFLSLLLIWLIKQVRDKELPFSWKKSAQIVTIVVIGIFLFSILWALLIISFSSIGGNLAISGNPQIAALGTKLALGGSAFIGLHENYPTAVILQTAIQRRLTSPGTWITLTALLFLTLGFLAGTSRKNSLLITSDDSPKNDQSPANIKVFILFLILIGTVLTFFPEFFYLRDQFGARMNTIFKFYFQAWIFWSLAAGFISVELFNSLKRWRYLVFSIFWSALILGGLAYPVLMLLNKTNNFTPVVWTLNGNDYIARYTPDEYAAMEWLSDKNVGVVAEAIGGSYTDYARVSTRTGFPTVLGWPGHESQWRGGATEMGSRYEDIKKLYETDFAEEANGILKQYNIRYVYLGNLERILYNVNQAKFDASLNTIYSNSSVIIYEVP